MSEQIYPLQLNPDYYVVTANDLIKGKQKMTLREAQLLYITMSQVVKEDKDFKTYSIAVSELASFMGIGPNALYRDLENICTSLLKRVVKIYVQDANNPSERKWKAFQWISAAEYENGKLTIKLNDELKPFLIELVSHYSQILLGTLCSFNSYYAARLYQYIVCEIGEHPRNPKEEWTFTCEELRDFFQIEKNEYARNYDLVRKTIKVALDELNKSDFTYIWDYEELRGPGKGRPLVGVKFKAAIFKDKDEKDWYLEKVHPLYQSQFEPKSEQLTLK
jgi:plasmid replication initiation protein